MRVSRRALLASTVTSTLVQSLGARAQTADFSYKYANNLPATHPMNVRAQEAAERIKKDTAGKFELQIFPNNQLGSDTDVLSQLRSGGVEFFTLSPLILSTLIPTASISGVGFAFPNYDVVWKAMDGELGAFMRAQITKARLVAMDRIWDNGFRQITTSTKPIQTLGRSARLQNPGAAEPTMDVNVYGVRGGSRHHQLRGDLYCRCRPRWSTGRRTRSPSSPRPNSTKSRNTAPLPITCGTGSGSSRMPPPGRPCSI